MASIQNRMSSYSPPIHTIGNTENVIHACIHTNAQKKKSIHPPIHTTFVPHILWIQEMSATLLLLLPSPCNRHHGSGNVTQTTESHVISISAKVRLFLAGSLCKRGVQIKLIYMYTHIHAQSMHKK